MLKLECAKVGLCFRYSAGKRMDVFV